VAYLLGAIPTGYVVVKRVTGEDVRAVGSGNIGATNVSRAAGHKIGVAVLVLDALTGALAVWLAGRMTGESAHWMSAAAIAVLAGNTFSVFLRFRGGKGFATAAGAMVMLAPLPTLALAPVFLVTAAATRHISAGSMLTTVSAPLAVWLIEHPGGMKIAAVAVMAAIILWQHRGNLRRLRDGNEPVFSFGRR
jgi:glycerol-3-phosphate acyltransferase PlsY